MTTTYAQYLILLWTLPYTNNLFQTHHMQYIYILYLYIILYIRYTDITFPSIHIFYFSEAGFKCCCFSRQGAQGISFQGQMSFGFGQTFLLEKLGILRRPEAERKWGTSLNISTILSRSYHKYWICVWKCLSQATGVELFLFTWGLGSLTRAGSPLQKAPLLLSGLSSMPWWKRDSGWSPMIGDC